MFEPDDLLLHASYRVLNGDALDEPLNETAGRLSLFALENLGRLWTS